MRIDSQMQLQNQKLEVSKQTEQQEDFQKIMENKLNQSGDNKLKEVSQRFESVFVSMMFKQMKDSGFESKLLDSGLSRDIFEDRYYNQLSKKVTKKADLGIAEAAYQQLK